MNTKGSLDILTAGTSSQVAGLSEDDFDSVSGGSSPIYVCSRYGASGSSSQNVKHTLWCATGTMGPDWTRSR